MHIRSSSKSFLAALNCDWPRLDAPLALWISHLFSPPKVPVPLWLASSSLGSLFLARNYILKPFFRTWNCSPTPSLPSALHPDSVCDCLYSMSSVHLCTCDLSPTPQVEPEPPPVERTVTRWGAGLQMHPKSPCPFCSLSTSTQCSVSSVVPLPAYLLGIPPIPTDNLLTAHLVI